MFNIYSDIFYPKSISILQYATIPLVNASVYICQTSEAARNSAKYKAKNTML